MVMSPFECPGLLVDKVEQPALLYEDVTHVAVNDPLVMSCCPRSDTVRLVWVITYRFNDIIMVLLSMYDFSDSSTLKGKKD